MPLITRKRVWTKQPQTATSIDWFDPLSKDLVAAFVFSNGLRDLVTGQFAENKGGVFVDSQLGRCFQAITAGINLPWDLNCTDDNVTVTLIEYREVSPTNYWFICDARQGSTGFAYGLSGNWTEPAVGAITAPGYKVTSTCKNATYQNAVKTSVTNGSNFAPRANLRLLGRYTDVDAYTNGAVAAIYIHKRNITQGEATSLYEQPWRLLKKQDKRIWIPSAGGGDVTIACTPGNATTAGITAGISSATTIAPATQETPQHQVLPVLCRSLSSAVSERPRRQALQPAYHLTRQSRLHAMQATRQPQGWPQEYRSTHRSRFHATLEQQRRQA